MLWFVSKFSVVFHGVKPGEYTVGLIDCHVLCKTSLAVQRWYVDRSAAKVDEFICTFMCGYVLMKHPVGKYKRT